MLSIKGIAKNIYNVSYKTADKISGSLPNIAVSNEKLLKGIKWAGEHISSPQNRLILGASALMTQPFIDLHNKRVDNETRKVSAARTVAKIIAGTTSGFLVRYYSIKALDAMAKIPSKNRKAYETFFTPSPEFVKLTVKSLGKYKKAFGTIMALWIMVATNFLFDAPVTKALTNKFIAINKHYADKKRNKNYPPSLPKPEDLAKYTSHKSETNLIDIAIQNFTGKFKNKKGGT